MTSTIRFSLIIICLMNIIAFGKPRCLSDTIYQRLSKTPISQMSDFEYNYFWKCHRRCCDDETCADLQLVNIMKSKQSISEMNINEAEYFEDMVFECDSINPCELPQYKTLLDKDTTKMSRAEYSFFDECRGSCFSYMKEHFPTKAQKRKKILRVLLIATGVVILAIAGYFSYTYIRY